MASVGNDNGENITLNIMPMLDIFSILILFLLMSFSTDPMNLDVNKNLTLPESDSSVSLDEVPTIIVSTEEILVNGLKVTDIVNSKVPPENLAQGAVLPLHKELLKVAQANKRIAKDGANKPGTIALEVDKSHPFLLIKQIMIAAQQAEFIDFKFLVNKTKT